MAFEQLVLSQMPRSSLIEHVIHALLDTWRHLNAQVREFDKAIARLASVSLSRVGCCYSQAMMKYARPVSK